jgi:hypothetical protein
LAKAPWREAVALAEDMPEVRCLAVAHQARHVSHRDRRLGRQELGRRPQPPRLKVLAEAQLAELGVGPL